MMTRPRASMAYRLPRLNVLMMNSRLIKAALLGACLAAHAHVDAFDIRMRPQLLRGALALDQAGAQHVSPVDDLQGAVHVLLDQEDGHTSLVQATDKHKDVEKQGWA